MNMSSWSSAGRQERRTKGTCIQSSLDGTSKFDGFYTISMDYRSGLSFLEEKKNITYCTISLYREPLVLIYSTYSLIIPKKFELRDIPFLFYRCQFISMKSVTCRRREGEGGGGWKEKERLREFHLWRVIQLRFQYIWFLKS